jgi:hypothetical protein
VNLLIISITHKNSIQPNSKLALAVLPSYEIMSRLAQNKAQDGGPITGNIMKVSPWCEFPHNKGGVVAI